MKTGTAIHPVKVAAPGKIRERDRRRFAIQRRRLTEALNLIRHADQFRGQLNLLIEILGDWLGEQSDKVQRAFLTVQDTSLAFLVVTREKAYDAEFDDALSDLEFDIAQDGELDLIRLRTGSLPNVSEDAMATFLGSEFLVEFERSAQ